MFSADKVLDDTLMKCKCCCNMVVRDAIPK